MSEKNDNQQQNPPVLVDKNMMEYNTYLTYEFIYVFVEKTKQIIKNTSIYHYTCKMTHTFH